MPFGGYFIDHAMKAIYYIEKMDNGNRRITVIKHRSIQENLFSEFKITILPAFSFNVVACFINILDISTPMNHT